jgi:hypothetical protein
LWGDKETYAMMKQKYDSVDETLNKKYPKRIFGLTQIGDSITFGNKKLNILFNPAYKVKNSTGKSGNSPQQMAVSAKRLVD